MIGNVAPLLSTLPSAFLPHAKVRVATSENKLLTNTLLKQTSPESSKNGGPSIPPPLNIPPSRARRQLAARLAKKKAEANEYADPDAADNVALETASKLPENPDESAIDLGPAAERDISESSGLQITGLRTVSGASRFSGLFGGSDDSSSSDGETGFDEDEAGRDPTLERSEGDYEDQGAEDSPSLAGRKRSEKNRRPSTTEAKERTPLYDEDDDEAADLGPALDAKLVLGGGLSADPVDVHDDSSEEDELVEIRPRRTS